MPQIDMDAKRKSLKEKLAALNPFAKVAKVIDDNTKKVKDASRRRK